VDNEWINPAIHIHLLSVLTDIDSLKQSKGITEMQTPKTLIQLKAENPFPDYCIWWRMGDKFMSYMSRAIISQWTALPGNNGDLSIVRDYVSDYMTIVYNRNARSDLVSDFVNKVQGQSFQSGEFDVLSYAFFRSAYELIEQHSEQYDHSPAQERGLFTKRVGKRFFQSVQDYLNLKLPSVVETPEHVNQLQLCIDSVGRFLLQQGYLRDDFKFTFDVDIQYRGHRIQQRKIDFLNDLNRNSVGYALYEMGYPAILPSAVYLYNIIGEAQHHSSRTIEELFDLVGYEARETDDFNPTGYPPDQVIELWEIKKSS
jgi:hypothetical protein